MLEILLHFFALSIWTMWKPEIFLAPFIRAVTLAAPSRESLFPSSSERSACVAIWSAQFRLRCPLWVRRGFIHWLEEEGECLVRRHGGSISREPAMRKEFLSVQGFPMWNITLWFLYVWWFCMEVKAPLVSYHISFWKGFFSLHVWGRKDDITRKMSLPLCPPSFSSSCKSVCLARKTLRARGKVENGKLFSQKKTDMKEEKKGEITNGNFLKEGHTVRNEFP